MMDGNGPADLAPHLDTVFARRYACDVNACTAFALHDIGHDEGQSSVLHQVNASFPRNGGLKNHETLGCGEPFDFSDARLAWRPARLHHQRLKETLETFHRCPFNNGPTTEQAHALSGEQVKQIREMFETVVWKVDQHNISLFTEDWGVLPGSRILTDDGGWFESEGVLCCPRVEVLLE